MTNTSVVGDVQTAHTAQDVAEARAHTLARLGVTGVLELCVGPSLCVLEQAYDRHGIRCWGNDIDERWQEFYRKGQWLIGDCFSIAWPKETDAVVFAPPLSRGCTGCRDDALMIDQVEPRYVDFLQALAGKNVKLAVLVLPARSLATKQDRSQLAKLEQQLQDSPGVVRVARREALSGRRRIRKYVELFVCLET